MTSARAEPHHTIPSLDGFRAVSVLIVMLSHAGFGHIIPGGLGVTIFFFLSGFLITTLLRSELGQTGTISIPNFYVRRFLRLGPPLVVVLSIAYGLVFLGLQPGGASWGGFLAQLLYFANYYGLFFDPGNSIPLGSGVLWSLAVEEHFYLVYPLLFLWISRRLDDKFVAWVFVTFCVCILLWRISRWATRFSF